jgi:hypothetical protein
MLFEEAEGRPPLGLFSCLLATCRAVAVEAP